MLIAVATLSSGKGMYGPVSVKNSSKIDHLFLRDLFLESLRHHRLSRGDELIDVFSSNINLLGLRIDDRDRRLRLSREHAVDDRPIRRQHVVEPEVAFDVS